MASDRVLDNKGAARIVPPVREHWAATLVAVAAAAAALIAFGSVAVLGAGRAPADPSTSTAATTEPAAAGAPSPPAPEPAIEYGLDTGPDAELVPPGVSISGGHADIYLPRTWEQFAANSDGPAIVRITAYTRTTGAGTSRHQATAEEAAAINATRRADSIKPLVQPGQWIGSAGTPVTYYHAEVTWLDAPRTRETLELAFPGGLASDQFVILDELPLPRIGSEYLMFLIVGDGWVSPIYVQFAIRGGRLQPHMHNEGGLGSALVGKTPDDLAGEMSRFTFSHARQATRP